MTSTGQEENFELPSFALIVQARSWFRFSSWISFVAGISKLKNALTSVVASATRTYLRVKDILRFCANFLRSVPSRWIENVWFLLVLTASQWLNVLFDPYLFEARPRYFVFLSFPRLSSVPNSFPFVTSLFEK